jgi:hypothetical protein
LGAPNYRRDRSGVVVTRSAVLFLKIFRPNGPRYQPPYVSFVPRGRRPLDNHAAELSSVMTKQPPRL